MKKRTLPRTPRVTEEICKYYKKFGNERDLEKFLRLYSSSSGSQDSCRTRSLDRNHKTKTTVTVETSSSGSSCEGGGGLRRLFCSKDSVAFLSSSQTDVEMEKESEPAAKELIVPIERVQASDVKSKQKQNMQEDSSSKELHTPEKPPKKHTKQTQTPESNSKTHKRLEWDSAGDVGYPISKSTGNLSELERVVLRAFFQKSLGEATATKKLSANASEGDLKRLEEELQQQSKVTKTQYTNTPPLASSTLIDYTAGKARSATEIVPNHINRSTSTSLLRKYEKEVQTSMNRPQLSSKEIQVHMASSVPSSMIGSSATNTSFEYYSSRSSRSQSTDRSSGKNSKQNKLPTRLPGGADTNYADKKAKDAQRQQRRELAEANKENEQRVVSATSSSISSISSVSKSASSVSCALPEEPQLDLGIALVCSVIDAHSLDNAEKKKLIQQVVKRICGLSGWQSGSKQLALKASAINQKETKPKSIRKEKAVLSLREHAENLFADRNENQVAANLEVRAKPSPPTTSAKALEKLAVERETRAKAEQLEKRKNAGMEKFLPPDEHLQKFTTTKAVQVIYQAKRSENSDAKSNRQTTSGQSSARTAGTMETETENGTTTTSLDRTKRSEDTTHSTTTSTAKTTTTTTTTTASNAATTTTTSTSSTTTTTASSSKEELITQKTANNQNTSNTDLEQASMGEWLNPMTQSEIEYEERRRQFAKNAGKREKLCSKVKDAKVDTERTTQLNWIEKEIKRLESLKSLLTKERSLSVTTETSIEQQPTEQEKLNEIHKQKTTPDSTEVTSTTTTKETSDATQSSCRIYDSVHTESSEHASHTSDGKSTPGGIQEIEVIIEESNEDVLDLDENLKRTRERRRETQIVYGKCTKEDDLGLPAGNENTKAKFRTVKETIVTNEEQVLPKEHEQKKDKSAVPPPTASTTSTAAAQRSRMESPAESNSAETVGSFAQQRKREFIDHYHKKLKNHYECLLQQQQQEQQRLQQQLLQQKRLLCQQQQQQTTGHYSVPYTTQRPPMHNPFQADYIEPYCYPHHHHHYHHEPHQPPPPPPPPPSHTVSAPQLPRHFTTQPNVICSTSAAAHLDHFTGRNQQNDASSTAQSMFCASSEVSVPMGSNAQSSIPTTTHQYDDVSSGRDIISNDGVGVQTGHSLQRSRPIFGPARQTTGYRPTRGDCRPHAVSSQTVCVQVRPRAIAYVIEFDKEEKNSKEKKKKAKEKSEEQTKDIPTASTSKDPTTAQASNSSSYTTISTNSSSVNASKNGDSKESGGNRTKHVKISESSTNSSGTTKTSTTSSTTTTTTTTTSSSSSSTDSGSGFQLTGTFSTQDYNTKMSLTLQEHLVHAKPEFVAHSKQRKAILNTMQALRQEREREMREIIENTSMNSLDRKLKHLPPPPTKQMRVFPTKEMRAMTNKRCQSLPENVAKKQRDREEERRRGNRLLRDVFNKRLQKRVRDGKLTLNHSKTVI